ncbi:hypothetical protein [uncultured Clostridium sp.]|uniref:hypothetical protein n=1 Tax=uncultured Clostridium sp. TaxID=59620 RepID=UPI0028E43360|nr:hypothetical protein [uncultured Clostridium sp.]
MKRNKYIIILMLIALPILFFFKKGTINRNKYQDYNLALEAALNDKFNHSKEEKYKNIKLLEKNIENKSILFFKTTRNLNETNKLIDSIFIIEIEKKNNTYTYEVTPDISLDYFGETNNIPYSLIEGVIEVDENRKLYYGIGKIIDKSYKLIIENKNYRDVNIVEDNIFIIIDEKEYQNIQFEKTN